MAGIVDRVRSLGSWLAVGAARAIGSFRARSEFHAARTRAQLRPSGTRRPGIGESLFSSTLAGSALYGFPGNWSSQRINQVMHFRHWSYIAIRAIMQHVSGLVPHIAWVDTEPERPRRKRLTQSPHPNRAARRRALSQQRRLRAAFRKQLVRKSMNALQPHERVTMVPADHPLRRLLEHPNALDTQGDLYAEIVLFLMLTGNAYLWVVPSQLPDRTGKSGLPAELWVIPAHWVHPRILRGQLPAYYDVIPFVGGGGSFKIPADEIIHLRFKNPIHKFDGYSPQTAGSEWIDAAESIDTARYWSFKNGCFPLGSLELPEGYAEPNDKELERIYAKFFARFRGESRFGAPIIPPPGGKYVPLTIVPQEMAFPESADQMMRWCLALWGVPPEVAGIQEQGSERAAYGPENMFRRHTLDPYLRQLGAWLTRALAHRWDDTLRLWFESTVEEDPKEVRANLQLAVSYGAVTIDEVRTMLLHLEPYEQGGDNPLVRPGLVPVPFNAPVAAEIQKALASGGAAQPPGGGAPAAEEGKPAGPEPMPWRTPEDEAEADDFGKPPAERQGDKETRRQGEQESGTIAADDLGREGKAFLDELLTGWYAEEPEPEPTRRRQRSGAFSTNGRKA